MCIRDSKRVYPIGANGEERVWRKSFESCKTLVAGAKLKCSENMTIYQLIEGHERTTALFSNWTDSRFNAGTHGANLLRDILGTKNAFAYPKSVSYTHLDVYKRQIQEKIQKLERQQRRQRQEIFSAEDEIMVKRDALIDSLEKRLTQRTQTETLFTIRWTVS